MFIRICFFIFVNVLILNANTLSLSKKDILILKKIKSLHDNKMMQYSLMAIAIKESSLGKHMINKKSQDYGLFQANIKTVLSRLKVKDSPKNRRYYAKKLVNDVAFSTANAIVELAYWQKVHKKSWFKTWASYNTGWRYKGKTGLRYAKSIYTIIRKLKLEYAL